MSDIFISYSQKDLDKVRPIAEALKNHGWEVWWDPEIRAGDPFDRVIEKALAKTRCVLVVWSQVSVDSDWVRAEASYGLNKGFLISIAIERDVAPPLRFINIHTEPLIDWDSKKVSPQYDKIVRDIDDVLERSKPTEEPVDKQIEHPDLDAMVEVPVGKFIYQDGKAIIEKPYLIDVYPVTNQQFAKFIEAGGYEGDQYWTYRGRKWQFENSNTEPEFWHNKKWNEPEQPVVGVSYFEAEAYAAWANKRLPTEKEWERAARGTDGRQFPWGNEFDKERCNTSESDIGKTTQAARYPNGISPDGCYDMAGNVWEWTLSWYDDQKKSKVLRGGSWYYEQDFARCAQPTLHSICSFASRRGLLRTNTLAA